MPVVVESTQAITAEPQQSPQLWRIVLIGLGPLTALAIVALLAAFFQRLA